MGDGAKNGKIGPLLDRIPWNIEVSAWGQALGLSMAQSLSASPWVGWGQKRRFQGVFVRNSPWFQGFIGWGQTSKSEPPDYWYPDLTQSSSAGDC